MVVEYRRIMEKGRKLELPQWQGEFGWEIMSWVPMCRKMAADYDYVVARSFEGMQALYSDFTDEFIANEENGRSLDYPKQYRHDGIFYRYGRAEDAGLTADVLIHARGIRRKRAINYRHWPKLAAMITRQGLSAGFIGSREDYCEPGYIDFREVGLQELMNKISAAKLVIGVSSGVMHLAAACGTDIIVWGDHRTYFGETLEQRYKITWNPFEVRVGWITAADFQPRPEEIIKKIKLIIRKTEHDLQLKDSLCEVV